MFRGIPHAAKYGNSRQLVSYRKFFLRLLPQSFLRVAAAGGVVRLRQ